MTDIPPVRTIELSPDMLRALNRLLVLMGPEKFYQLAVLMQDVISDTGYGDVKVVITQGTVARLKVEKSYD